MVIGVSSCFRRGYGSDSSFKEMPLRAFIAATMVPYSFWIIGAGVPLGRKMASKLVSPCPTARRPSASRLSLGKIAELHRPRRHPKAFGTPSNSLSGPPSSVPCPRSDACRAKECLNV